MILKMVNKKKLDEERLEKVISCVSTKKQKKELEEKAKKEDTTVSHYVRRILFPIMEEKED